MNEKKNSFFWSINLHPEEFIEMEVVKEEKSHWVFPKGDYLELIDTNTKFRVNEALANDKLDAIIDLGARYVRADFAWNYVQPVQLKHDGEIVWNESAFSAFKKYLELLDFYHLGLICILFRSPKWINDLKVAQKESDIWSAFKVYSKEVATRFGKHIKHFQLWNEPNNFITDPNAGYNCNYYARLMLSGDEGIRECNIDHVCSMNIMANNDTGWQDHLQQYFRIMKSDPNHTISIIGIDHYPGTWSLGIDCWHDWLPLDAVANLVKGSGDCAGKEISIMETGYASGGHWPVVEQEHHQEGQELWINDSLPVAYEKMLKLNAEKSGRVIFFNWYELQDGDKNPKDIFNFEQNFGIQSKIGYDSLKRVIGFNTQNLSAAYSDQEKCSNFIIRTSTGKLICYSVNTVGEASISAAFNEAGVGNGDIACVYNDKRKHVEVFAKGADKHIHYFYYEGGRWNWGGTFFFYTQVFGTIAAVYNPNRNNSEFYFKGSDGYLHFCYVNNSNWAHDSSSFIDKGGKVRGSISAIYNKNHQHSAVFYKGQNGLLHYCFVEAGTWKWGGEWFYGAGEVKGDIAAVYNRTQQSPEVFFKGGNNKLYHFYIENGQWTVNKQLPDEKPLGEMSVIFNPLSSHPDLFFMGDKGYLKHIFYQNGIWAVEEKAYMDAPLIEGGISAVWTGYSVEVFYRTRENNAVRFYNENNHWNHQVIEIE